MGQPTSSRHNLPAEVASFVGREGELAELQRILLGSRLLTLTGVGGAGKSRLALQVAARVALNYPDGVWQVQLAPLTDSASIPRVVAATLGVRGTPGQPHISTLASALSRRRLLLVLDNCEHLIGACARIAETLLGACPQLRILATSREPLRIPGEVTWRVRPLELPGVELQPQPEEAMLSPESLAGIESVQLFLDRARARTPGFTLTVQTAPIVAEICRRVEGLPLGIELAAAQVAVQTPEQIARRLDDSLRLLGGGSRTLPRQETLRATLEWSYRLLTEPERALFRRLAVFAGSFDLEAVESVCAGGDIEGNDVLPLLTNLAEKSLVEPQVEDSAARFRLLEPARQYAWEQLLSAGEEDGLQRGHACHFLKVAEAAEPWLMSGDRGPWMVRLANEQHNFRSALTWCRNSAAVGDRELGLRLVGALMWFWNFRGEVSEGLDWVEAVLSRGKGAAPEVRAKALYAACELAWLAGKTALARERAEESEALWRSLAGSGSAGSKRWLAYTLQSLPMATDHPRSREAVAESLRLLEEAGDDWGAALAMGAADLFPLMSGDDPSSEGEARLEEGLERARKVGDEWLIAQRLNFLGDLARSQGENAKAAARYEEALGLLRRQDLTSTVPSLLHNLAYVALRQGETRRALRHFRESLALFRSQGDQRGVADCLDGVACALARIGHPEGAAQLLGGAEALRERIGVAIWPGNIADRDRGLAAIREQLAESELASAWAEGKSLSLDLAAQRVLAEEPPGQSTDTVANSELTRRELETAVLVARGMTNRQIGAALFITEGTARLHVKHILSKLGFTSRSQIAAWAVEQGLADAPQPQ